MPIIFINSVAKADISPEETAFKSLQRLRRYINDAQPDIVEWVMRFWGDQKKAATYKELREAILSGAITPEMVKRWQQDYSAFVTDTLLPQWTDAMSDAAQQIAAVHPEYEFNPGAENVKAWTAQHSAKLVTNLSTQQTSAINSLIQRAAGMQDMTVDELARAIRPVIGLTKPQATSNFNYYTTLRQNKVPPKEALSKSYTYAARQQRYRAMNIARTELATAYNNGEYLGIKQAQEQNLMGEVKKKWLTADDGRVCAVCQSIDEMEIAMDALFPIFGGLLTPTAHPSCRCCLIYEEVEVAA